MQLSISTWNINSVRLRIGLVKQFLEQHQPDILCLQETKCPDDSFPLKEFARLGYENAAISGQKSYNGVAILSRHPFDDISTRPFCTRADCRHIKVTLGQNARWPKTLHLHNFYVPAGGDIPDPALNDKFAHKLQFLDEMREWDDLKAADSNQNAVLVGDLNIAPFEHDVWSHTALRDVVSHTAIECEKLNTLRDQGQWIDVMRKDVAMDEKLYSWWSYRAQDWEKSDRGRRLDHIWITPQLLPTYQKMSVLKAARGWERPSDHVPVTAYFEL